MYNKRCTGVLLVNKSEDIPRWVKWIHEPAGIFHCLECLQLDGCWFTWDNAPICPHHDKCHNLLGGFITFFEPSGIITEYGTITLHTFTWHMVPVFTGLHLGFSNRGGWEMADYKDAVKIFLALCVIAFSINVMFQDVSENSINMFFIGPQNSSLIVFKQISEMFGWYVSTAVYIPAVCIGAYIIFLPFYLAGSYQHSISMKLKHA